MSRQRATLWMFMAAFTAPAGKRIAGEGNTLPASTVMTWDSAGAWQQVVFRPILVSLRRGRLSPYGALRRSLFWRRLQPIGDFGRGNVLVVAAEVEGPCR